MAKIKETKITEVKKEVVVGMICDNCEKEIILGSGSIYFSVTTSHSNWGNDSIDSIEHYELCSKSCLFNHLDDYYLEASQPNNVNYDIETEIA